MNNKIKEVILEIARCKEIEPAYNSEDNPCHKVVHANGKRLEKFQCPEPFDGQIDKAKYLIISSNPAYKEDESYVEEGANIRQFPHISDSIEKNEYICDFFYNRIFKGEYEGKKYEYDYANEPYLKSCLKIIAWVNEKELSDYTDEELIALRNQVCLTEVVHCKSMAEEGVKKPCACKNKCGKLYMRKIIQLFRMSPEKEKYIVICGSTALDYFSKKKNLDNHKLIEECKKEGIKFIKAFQPSRTAAKSEEDRKNEILESKNNEDWLN